MNDRPKTRPILLVPPGFMTVHQIVPAADIRGIEKEPGPPEKTERRPGERKIDLGDE